MSSLPSFEHFENEEELKIGFLVPLLEQCGAHRSDLKFEMSFRLKVGRQTITEDANKALEEKRPRLDILVTQDGRNLFVLEAKRKGQPLTDADRDQAVSYSRLVHPMAPYALVSNGDETRAYRTDTREQLNPKDADLDGFEVVLPGTDDLDALACFLRLSPRNLLRFCRAQASDSMKAPQLRFHTNPQESEASLRL